MSASPRGGTRPRVPSPAPLFALGAYGLRIDGLESALLAEVDPRAPRLDVTIESGRLTDRRESYGDWGAEISLVDEGWVTLSREGRAHFVIPGSPSSDEVIHPWLVPAAATLNGWLGRQVLHGGAFAINGHGVVVIGHKEDGKSSLLAWLAQSGMAEVLADDLAVIDRGMILAGPRCIDLRAGSASAVQDAGSLRLVRNADRLRLDLAPCSRFATLRAIVILGWVPGEEISLELLSQAGGFAALLPHALSAGLSGNLLDLLGVPVWALRRPRTWSSMPEVVRQIAGVIDPTRDAIPGQLNASPATI